MTECFFHVFHVSRRGRKFWSSAALEPRLNQVENACETVIRPEYENVGQTDGYFRGFTALCIPTSDKFLPDECKGHMLQFLTFACLPRPALGCDPKTRTNFSSKGVAVGQNLCQTIAAHPQGDVSRKPLSFNFDPYGTSIFDSEKIHLHQQFQAIRACGAQRIIYCDIGQRIPGHERVII